MDFPAELKYTKDHEWVRADGKQYTVGITEFAQSELGEIVFVELPSVGRELKAGETLCVVESTKAASDVYAPVSGKVVEVNTKLQDSPDLVNSNPYGEGWMVKFEALNESELAALMDSSAYASSVAS